VAPNLRTFLPPNDNRPAAVPEVGDAAPALMGAEDAGPRVIAFLRHTGCPFAEATLRAAREVADTFADADIVAVSHSDPQATAAWSERCGGAGRVRVVADEERAAYAAWGLGRSSLSHFLGARSLRSVARQARRGIRNTRAHGTRWQQAGTFAVDATGTVVWRHLPAHAGDLPDLEAAARAARAP
jgi:AhpC/TSA antioxidant enzyme